MINHFVNEGFVYDVEVVDRIVARITTDFKRPLLQLNIIQLNDEQLKQVNIDFLGHHYYTDVITFDLHPNEMEGEIYISYERAKENEKNFQTQNEIIRLIIHGCLHLCGMEDDTYELKKEIHQMEDHYMNMFHVKH